MSTSQQRRRVLLNNGDNNNRSCKSRIMCLLIVGVLVILIFINNNRNSNNITLADLASSVLIVDDSSTTTTNTMFVEQNPNSNNTTADSVTENATSKSDDKEEEEEDVESESTDTVSNNANNDENDKDNDSGHVHQEDKQQQQESHQQQESQQHSSHGLNCELYGGPFTKEAVYDEMVYWYDIRTDNYFKSQLQHPTTKQYFTMEPDEGGWNNIRMAFETALGIAIMTGRIFVLPPKMNFYLLWFATNQSDNTVGFDSFFPLDSVQQEHSSTTTTKNKNRNGGIVNVITFEEFVDTVITPGKLIDPNTNLPAVPPFQLSSSTSSGDGKLNIQNYAAARRGDGQKLWIWFRNVTTMLQWNYGHCVAVFPNERGSESIQRIQTMFTAAISNTFNDPNTNFSNFSKEKWMMNANQRMNSYNNNPTSVSNPNTNERLAEIITTRRELCIYDEYLQNNATYLHGIGQQDTGYRLLVHFYAFLFFENYHHDLWYKRFVRDHLRYIDQVQCAAARVIEKVRYNAYIYSGQTTNVYHSLHVRRGDFQYKDMRSISANDIYDLNTKGIIPDNSTVFIATDEKNISFFQPLMDHYNVYFLSNFINPADTENYVVGDNVNKNYYGMIDQLVASKGDIFFGAYYSTFTGYINRLRGYWTQKRHDANWELGIIDKSYYYVPTKRKKLKDSYRRYHPLQPPYWAREFPIAWRDINHDIEV